MFRGIFIADLHCSKNRYKGCKKVLEQLFIKLKEYSPEERPYLFICGDFWDATTTATETSGYSDFITLVADLRILTKVFFIYGTAGHEPAGCLKQFQLIDCTVFSMPTFVEYEDFELIAFPEPRKSNYISLCKKNENINEVVNNELNKFIDSIPPKKDKPRVVMYHGEIKGVEYNNAKACDSPIALSISQLKKMNADFYGCGHIHKIQEVFENCWYLGSCPPKSADEIHDASFWEVEIC